MPQQSEDKSKKKYKPRVFKGTVYIIKERCKGCGFCIEYCPKKILQESKEFNEKGYHYPVVIDEDECVNCKVCEDICPEFAIYSLVKEETKEKPTNKDKDKKK
ncbi:MAG: 4Fe-4S binding protein [Candidatus Omnitrophota bacterium]|nr:MAG: 4Fe-4S binding protein [Candidatus Omnitrophota bacterium]